MTKAELISRVAQAMKESKAHTERMLDAFLLSIEGSLVQGADVVLHGFGKFSVSKRAAQIGRNPRTGEAVPIPATRVVKFKAQKALKDAVNG